MINASTKSASKLRNSLKSGCVQECPGCDHRHFTHEHSLAQKKSWLDTALSPWKDRLEPVSSGSANSRWSYRDRVCLKAEWKQESGWLIGLQIKQRLIKKTISIPECPVHSERVNRIVKWVIEHAPDTRQLPLAYLVISGGHLTFVLKSKDPVDLSWCTHLIKLNLVQSLWICNHPSAGNKIFQESGWKLIAGSEWLVEDGLYYGPDAFRQPIKDLHFAALNVVKDFFNPNRDSAILDLYCGNGSSLMLWKNAGSEFLGIELSGNSIQATQMSFGPNRSLRGTTDQRLPQMEEWAQRQHWKNLYLYLNPPRTGIESKTLDWILNRLKPKKMAYLSCSAGTLKRDLVQIEAAGYEIEKILPFDFFPQTRHVESLVLLFPKQI